MRILVAEDDPINRRLLEVSLKQWGHEVTVATDGTEAWELLRAPQPPPLAILDWMMPGVDGVELCRRVRALPGPRVAYLILLTARGQAQDVVEGLQAGADDYVVKPFDPPELRSRVQAGVRTLELQEQLMAQARALQTARAELAAQERFSEAVADMSDGILTFDEHWRLWTANRSACLLLALPEDGWEGRTLEEVIAPFAVPVTAADLRERSERVTAFEITRPETHPPLLLDARLSRRRDAAGTLLGSVLTVRDVTDERLPRHVQANFMTALPHKLRTPLALLLGYLNMTRRLDDEGLIKHWPQISGIWERELQRLIDMVQKLLDFEHLTLADLESETPEAEVAPAVAEALAEARRRYPERAVELTEDLAPGLRVACRDDHLRFVLTELLGNAVKFGDKLPVAVTVQARPLASGRAHLSVSDNGPGIPHEYYDRVFDGFVQVEEHVTGQIPGFGLGLRMARQIVEAYGGQISVTSRLGEGSTFTIELPLPAASSAGPEQESAGG